MNADFGQSKKFGAMPRAPLSAERSTPPGVMISLIVARRADEGGQAGLYAIADRPVAAERVQAPPGG